jgi:cell division protein FtsL
LKKTAIGAVVLFLAAAGFSRFEGVQQTLGKMEWYAFGVLAEFAVLLVALPILLLRAPWLLEKETVKQLEDKVDGQQSRLDQLEKQLAELTAEKAARVQEAVDSAQKARSYAAMNMLKQTLLDLIEEWDKSYPRVISNAEMHEKPQRHAQGMKDALVNWLGRAREEASKVSLSDYLAQEAVLQAIPLDFHKKLKPFSERQVDAVDAILRRLS